MFGFFINVVFTLSGNYHSANELQPCWKSDTLMIIIVFDWIEEKKFFLDVEIYRYTIIIIIY